MAYADLHIDLTPQPVGWTYGGIITHFARRFNKQNDEEYKERIRNIIRNVLLNIMGRHTFSWMRSTDTIQTEAGEAQYPLAVDCAYPIGQMTLPPYGTLERKPLHILRRLQGGTAAQHRPMAFSIVQDNVVEVYPIPDAEYSILYDYILTIPDVIEDDEEPALPRREQHVLMHGIEIELRSDDDRFDRAITVLENRFERGILHMIWRDEQSSRDQAIPEQLPPRGWF